MSVLCTLKIVMNHYHQLWQSLFDWQPFDEQLFITALTHKSHYNENPDQQHNERLEYLGDAVLELVVSSYLYQEFPQEQEGKLTKMRSALVKGDNLAKVSQTLDISQHIRLSSGETKAGGGAKTSVLANTLEALIGAIYLDQGLPTAEDFIMQHIVSTLDQVTSITDPKSAFQEWAQAQHNMTPVYKLTADNGPDHDKTYTMQVSLGDTIYGQGTGTSKQKAEIAAAQNALEQMIRMKEK